MRLPFADCGHWVGIKLARHLRDSERQLYRKLAQGDIELAGELI